MAYTPLGHCTAVRGALPVAGSTTATGSGPGTACSRTSEVDTVSCRDLFLLDKYASSCCVSHGLSALRAVPAVYTVNATYSAASSGTG